MPVAGIPMLDYLIDYLSDNNIEQVYILCTIHSQRITEYVKSQHYKSYRNLKIHTVACKGATSVGAALRSFLEHYVDTPIVRDDFIVLRGDVITNVPLDRAIKEHIERKAKNDKCMVTKTFVRMCHANRLRTQEDDTVVLAEPSSKLLLQYQKLKGEEKINLKGCSIPVGSSVEIRYDLYDCHIDICTPELLYYMRDNFDCKDLQDKFVNEVNSPDSIVENKVFYYEYDEPKNAYCAVIYNPLIYSYVTQDLIRRYAYPLVIDSNLMCPGANLSFRYTRDNIYMEENTKLSMTCIISPNSVIGKDSEVQDRAVVESSTVGRGCCIRARARVVDSCLWGNVTIEEDCVITGAIICDNVVVRKGAVVSKGAILDNDVSQ